MRYANKKQYHIKMMIYDDSFNKEEFYWGDC